MTFGSMIGSIPAPLPPCFTFSPVLLLLPTPLAVDFESPLVALSWILNLFFRLFLFRRGVSPVFFFLGHCRVTLFFKQRFGSPCPQTIVLCPGSALSFSFPPEVGRLHPVDGSKVFFFNGETAFVATPPFLVFYFSVLPSASWWASPFLHCPPLGCVEQNSFQGM